MKYHYIEDRCMWSAIKVLYLLCFCLYLSGCCNMNDHQGAIVRYWDLKDVRFYLSHDQRDLYIAFSDASSIRALIGIEYDINCNSEVCNVSFSLDEGWGTDSAPPSNIYQIASGDFIIVIPIPVNCSKAMNVYYIDHDGVYSIRMKGVVSEPFKKYVPITPPNPFDI